MRFDFIFYDHEKHFHIYAYDLFFFACNFFFLHVRFFSYADNTFGTKLTPYSIVDIVHISTS
uniref:Uncharacterized protein n=1 Tax=Anguilla anguilla TaxID=7936 RepID=A0A0E9R3Y2_ANGAN